jgi:hypothetical protein
MIAQTAGKKLIFPLCSEHENRMYFTEVKADSHDSGAGHPPSSNRECLPMGTMDEGVTRTVRDFLYGLETIDTK